METTLPCLQRSCDDLMIRHLQYSEYSDLSTDFLQHGPQRFVRENREVSYLLDSRLIEICGFVSPAALQLLQVLITLVL